MVSETIFQNYYGNIKDNKADGRSILPARFKQGGQR
jgi:hypothetical protein